MYSVGIAGKVFVRWLNIIEQFLHIFEKHCECPDVMLRRLGILGMLDVFGPPAFGIASISELSADPTVRFDNCHYWPSIAIDCGRHSTRAMICRVSV
jgi:hypothetical protein